MNHLKLRVARISITLLAIFINSNSFTLTLADEFITMPPFAAIVHPFPSSTAGSCAYERGDASFPNALVFIGGLTAGPHSADLTVLFECLGQTTWSLWEFRMRSSYTGFGFSSLADDVEDISALVKYLRGIGKERVVIMGHSTGELVPLPMRDMVV